MKVLYFSKIYNYYTMQQIASLRSFQSIEQRTKLLNLIAKIDRILRLARMAKVKDPSSINEVKERCKGITKQIQKAEGEKFSLIQEKISNYINGCIAQLCEKKVTPIPIKQPPPTNGNAINSKQNSKISSFGNLQQKINHEKESSISLIHRSSQIEKSREQEREKEKERTQKKQFIQSNNNNTQTKTQINSSLIKKQSSIQIEGKNSQSISSNPPPISLKDYCMHNFNNIQAKLIINEDIVNYMKNQDPAKVALLGVQKPRDLANQKLFVCTYMEFLKEEITSANVSYQEHQIEVDQFVNVVRYPLILSVIGQTVSDMKIHFVKFLLSMTSPLPLVIIFNQMAPEKSIVIKMNEKVISNIENCTLLQLDSQTMKDKNKYKCTSFKQIAVGRDKLVATKQLERKLKNQVKQNDQAITIQKLNRMEFKEPYPIKQPANKVQSKMQGELIVKDLKKQNLKVQSISDISSANYEFKYILHTKFAAAAWADYFIYLVTDERELTSRKKQKSVEEMFDFVKNSTNECVIGCSLKTSDKRIPPLLFSIQFKQRKKCPMILIKLKNLTLNKLVFIRLKEEASQEEVMNTVITYKDLQESIPSFIQVLLVGQKTETIKYQGKNPLKEI